jgi:F-type H+-transporting ATPase subunit epsilon
MATFAFELVSPERLLFSGQVDQVVVPGMEGISPSCGTICPS